MLSGFVLASAYVPRFEQGMGVFPFMKARAKRLYPLYFVGLMLGLLARAQNDVGHALLYVPLGLLGLPTPGPATMELYALNPASWSLFAEWIINVAFVLFLWRLSNRGLLILMAVSAAFMCLAFYIFGNIGGGSNIGNAWVGLARVGYSFPMGMLIHRLYLHHKLDRFRITSTWFGFFLPILMIALFLFKNDLIIAFFAFPLLVLAGAMFEPKAANFWLKLGAISYPLYCIHGPILLVVRHIAIRMPHSEIIGTIGMAGIIAASFAADHVLERHVRPWSKRHVRPWLTRTLAA